jgi:hypothetical protein
MSPVLKTMKLRRNSKFERSPTYIGSPLGMNALNCLDDSMGKQRFLTPGFNFTPKRKTLSPRVKLHPYVVYILCTFGIF